MVPVVVVGVVAAAVDTDSRREVLALAIGPSETDTALGHHA